MKYLLSGAMVYKQGMFHRADVLVCNGRIVDVSPRVPITADTHVFSLDGLFIFPGLVDVHVHLREPGFLYKETIETGTLAAARGGYTSVCAMPNLNPVPDSAESLDVQLARIRESAHVHVYPYGAITKGERGDELAALDEMQAQVVAFSDDGRGVQNRELMKEAMKTAKRFDKLIAAHCEDTSCLGGTHIHDGEYARAIGHRGISSESEWRQVARDLELVSETGCRYHVCHVSTKESVELIRNAKKKGLPVTCETAPHYLVLDDSRLQNHGRFKMNPPIRGIDDRDALRDGVCDGTIDMIATDHAPHSEEEKSGGLFGGAMGVTGLEAAFPVLYTCLVETKILSLERLIELMSVNPNEIFRIGSLIDVGERADLTVFDLNASYKLDSTKFASKGHSTPFDGMEVNAKCVMTMVDGRIQWKENLTER